MTIVTPCIDICDMNPNTGLCEGCFRTLHEIAVWGSLPDGERRTILKDLKARRRNHQPSAPLSPPRDT